MRNPCIDPLIGDKLKGQNQIRVVISVGERKNVLPKGYGEHLPEKETIVCYKRKNGDQGWCTLKVWRNWAASAREVVAT